VARLSLVESAQDMAESWNGMWSLIVRSAKERTESSKAMGPRSSNPPKNRLNWPAPHFKIKTIRKRVRSASVLGYLEIPWFSAKFAAPDSFSGHCCPSPFRNFGEGIWKWMICTALTGGRVIWGKQRCHQLHEIIDSHDFVHCRRLLGAGESAGLLLEIQEVAKWVDFPDAARYLLRMKSLKIVIRVARNRQRRAEKSPISPVKTRCIWRNLFIKKTLGNRCPRAAGGALKPIWKSINWNRIFIVFEMAAGPWLFGIKD